MDTNETTNYNGTIRKDSMKWNKMVYHIISITRLLISHVHPIRNIEFIESVQLKDRGIDHFVYYK
jgi:hypothetical protein